MLTSQINVSNGLVGLQCIWDHLYSFITKFVNCMQVLILPPADDSGFLLYTLLSLLLTPLSPLTLFSLNFSLRSWVPFLNSTPSTYHTPCPSLPLPSPSSLFFVFFSFFLFLGFLGKKLSHHSSTIFLTFPTSNSRMVNQNRHFRSSLTGREKFNFLKLFFTAFDWNLGI